MKYIQILIITLSISAVSCGMKNRRIDTAFNGFLNENCYQALVKIKPERNTSGLVGQRESAYLKTKRADIDRHVLNNLVSYCISHRLKKFHLSKGLNQTITPRYRLYLEKNLSGLARKNKIFFTYYNEYNAVVLGCRITAANLKKRIEGIMTSATLDIVQ